MQVWSLGWEDPLEEEIATHSSILAWKIPWTEEPGGLKSMESQRAGHDWSNLAHMHASLPTAPCLELDFLNCGRAINPKVTCFLFLLPPAVCPYLLSHIFLFSFCSIIFPDSTLVLLWQKGQAWNLTQYTRNPSLTFTTKRKDNSINSVSPIFHPLFLQLLRFWNE